MIIPLDSRYFKEKKYLNLESFFCYGKFDSNRDVLADNEICFGDVIFRNYTSEINYVNGNFYVLEIQKNEYHPDGVHDLVRVLYNVTDKEWYI